MDFTFTQELLNFINRIQLGQAELWTIFICANDKHRYAEINESFYSIYFIEID